MALHISYFAWVREGMARDGEVVDPPADVQTIAELVRWLAARDAPGAAIFSDLARIRCARNGVMVPLETAIDGATMIDLFPPVTGG
jgi:sulfur-carrier protein